MTPSYKIAYPAGGDLGDQINYTGIIRSAAGPLRDTVRLTDTIPNGLIYMSGTPTSTAGVIFEAAAPSLYWTGALSPTPVITVTYAATVDTNESEAITNSAVIASPGYQPVTRAATILANPYRLYLPVVLRDG